MTKKPKKVVGEDEDDGIEGFEVSYMPKKSGTWIIDIDDTIVDKKQMQDAVKVLGIADEDNPVQINLQTNGGSYPATDMLLHAMRKCEADIHIIATGGVHSCGTLILLEADTFELSDGFHALIHNGGMGAGGNFNEYDAQAKFDANFWASMLKRTYEGFLTEYELEEVLKGVNIWLDAEGWMERWNKRNLHFKAKYEATLAPVKKPRVKKTVAKPE